MRPLLVPAQLQTEKVDYFSKSRPGTCLPSLACYICNKGVLLDTRRTWLVGDDLARVAPQPHKVAPPNSLRIEGEEKSRLRDDAATEEEIRLAFHARAAAEHQAEGFASAAALGPPCLALYSARYHRLCDAWFTRSLSVASVTALPVRAS